MRLPVVAAVLVAALAMSSAAVAQGKGGGRRPQAPPGPPARSGSQTSTAAVTLPQSPSFPQFGSWLDDATTASEGAGYASIAAAYWSGANANQIDAPVLGVTYGITDRVQLSATIPFYRVSYEGFSGSGLDNVYISGKFAVVSPDSGAGRFGAALGVVAEILSAGFTEASRSHWAVPLSVELRAHPVRLYGSTGYFSRGAYFAAGAVEWTAPTGTSLTAAVTHSASIRGVTVATIATVPGATLRDASVFVSHPVSGNASVYGAGSRSFSSTRINGASVSGGLSFRFTGR